MKRYIALISMLCCLFTSSAQLMRDSVRVYFRQGKSLMDVRYLDNEQNLDLLAQRYMLYSRYPQYRLKGIRIVSSASPEGSFALNRQLSKRRADAVLDYLKKHSVLDSTLLQISSLGENWEMLRYVVEHDADMAYRSEILESLDRYPDGEEGEWDLKRIANGEAYRYLYNKVYPLLRQTNVVFDVVKEREYDFSSLPLKRLVPVFEPLPKPVYAPPMKQDTLTFAVKTNLLYDLATALNVEVEVPIGNHWSVMVEDVFPWWETGNKYCIQLWEMGLEGRYWFRNNRYHSQKLKGHFAGVYLMSGKYDFQWNKKICYQGEGWSAGVTYGYSMPLGKKCHLEYSLSVGYLRAKYQHYQPSGDYEHLYRDPDKAGKLSIIGPTKLKVSLVVPVNMKWRTKR